MQRPTKLDVGKWFRALASATDFAEGALGGWRVGHAARDSKRRFICSNCFSQAAMTKRDARAPCRPKLYDCSCFDHRCLSDFAT